MNGWIEQCGTVTITETTSTIDLYISYTSKNTYWLSSAPTTQNLNDTTTYWALNKIVSEKQFQTVWFDQNAQPRNKQWKTIGY